MRRAAKDVVDEQNVQPVHIAPVVGVGGEADLVPAAVTSSDLLFGAAQPQQTTPKNT